VITKYLKFLYSILERIGQKNTKQILFITNTDENKSVNKSHNILQIISVRCCTKEDINTFFEGDKKLRFREDLDQGHVMIGGFIKKDLVAYAWLNYQKIYINKIEKWIDFKEGYIWKGSTKEKKPHKGIKLEMLRHALKIAKDEGKKDIYALTDVSNIPTQRALESIGFKKQQIIAYSKFFNIQEQITK